MLRRTIEKYVLPAAAAAAAPAASGAAGTTAAAGGAGGGGGAAGGGAAASRGAAAGEASKAMPKGGAGMDPGTAIRAAGAQTAGFVNAFSSIPESAGGRYRADLERIKAQRYAEQAGGPSPYHEDGPSHWTDKNGVPNLNFAWAKKHYGKMPDESLRWHIKDAQEAMRANPDNKKNGAYADVVHVASQILKERQDRGTGVPLPTISDRPGHGRLDVSVGQSFGGS